MYFVVIDVQQLWTRLQNMAGRNAVDLTAWLNRNGFIQTPEGWYGTADSMNSLSCSEILFSEWRHALSSPVTSQQRLPA